MKTFRTFLLGLAAAVALTVHVRGETVTATLDPSQISMGDSTQLTVTVSGGSSQPEMPKIDGLEIMGVSESTQIQFINGAMTQNSTRTFQVTPQRAGIFTIPALQSGNAKSQPLTLRVGQGPSGVVQAPAPAQTPNGQGPVVTPPNAPPMPGNAQQQPVATGKYGSLEVTLPKKEFYEGELVPVEITALISAEVRVDSVDAPVFSSDGFALNSLGKPEQTQREIDGHVFHVLLWHTALTAIKAGDFPLNLKMPLTVIVPQQMPQFGDDADAMINNFMRNPFASMMGTKKEVNLVGDTETLKVLPLPQANKPADFSGAVGQFEASASASPTKVNAGDPVTLRLTITGRGNFDRVASDMLVGDANWKTYSPKNHFDAQDSAGYEGTKTFEQPVIANNGSITAVPSLTFSYFDPDKKQYVTCTTPPVPISVSGAPAAPAPAPVPGPASTQPSVAANPPPQPVYTPSDLRMNRIEPGSFVSTLQPVYLSPVFLAGQALPLVALLGGLAFLRRQQSVSQPDRVRLSAMQKAVREQVAEMDVAMGEGKADAFFIHARNALQQRYGQEWNMRPEAITVADIVARLGADGENVRTVFEMADQASYSDLHFGEADLQQWREVVVSKLAEAKR